jgi:hypothetical protein
LVVCQIANNQLHNKNFMTPVKIKLRPGQVTRFPGNCVHCGQTAVAGMTLRRRIDRITRLVEAPVCAACHQELQQQSGEEERLGRLGLAATAAALTVTFVLLLILLPSGLPALLRLPLALLLALVPATAVYSHFRRARRAAARPEKRAILESARMAHFSWRATTFEFANDRFAKEFAQLNRSLLMD